MPHQEQQRQLALATSTSVLADINVLCVASELHESTRALASAPPSHRHGTEFLAEFRIVYEFLFLSGIHELQNA